ncbi:MAG TPA: transglutaminase family protein [Xanthobacteraceae bacterium]|nr:transglutaminase family protein [Xanthobacteraceae bacterium]
MNRIRFEDDMDPYLAPARFIDSDNEAVIDFARQAVTGIGDPRARVIRLFETVRDQIAYDPYVDILDETNFRASSVLKARRGFCVGKAALLAACARVIGIPAGVAYADVRNHMTTPRLYQLMQTDIFVWHSYTDICLDGVWLKATPTFDRAVCERLGLKPLEFDGRSDSLLHPYDRGGRRHMEYLRFRGTFPDVPFETISRALVTEYPNLAAQHGIKGDFRREAVVPDG